MREPTPLFRVVVLLPCTHRGSYSLALWPSPSLAVYALVLRRCGVQVLTSEIQHALIENGTWRPGFEPFGDLDGDALFQHESASRVVAALREIPALAGRAFVRPFPTGVQAARNG